MFNFDGTAGDVGRVDLGGRGNRNRARGAADESRSEFVKRQHREREARERHRVRQRAATLVQATFRRHRCLRIERSAHRQIFDKRQSDIAKVGVKLPPDVKAKFVFNALVPMLRLFTFFFTPHQDDVRLSAILDLVLLSAGQPAVCNLFHMAIRDDAQRLSLLILIEKLVVSTLASARFNDTVHLLLSMQATLFSGPPDYRPVDVFKSGSAVSFVLRRSQVLRELTRSISTQAKMGELTLFFCIGLDADCGPGADDLLACLLSAPNLGLFLCEVSATDNLARECLRRIISLVSTRLPPPATSSVLAEEVEGVPRRAWLVGNLVTILERHVLLGGCTANLLPWLAWLCRAKEQPHSETWHRRLTEELERLHRASFVRAILQCVDRDNTDGLLAVCQLFFAPWANNSDSDPPQEVLQTLAFATPMAERLFPSILALMRSASIESVYEALGPPEFTSAEATRLRVFCTVYALQLQPMYDYEFFGSANPLRIHEVERLTPLLNRLAFHLVTTLPSLSTMTPVAKALRSSLTSLVRILYNRHRRRPILREPNAWIIPESRLLLRKAPVIDLGVDSGSEQVGDDDIMEVEEAIAGSTMVGASSGSRQRPRPAEPPVAVHSVVASPGIPAAEQVLEAVLDEIPHVLPFEDRVALLHNVIIADQEQRRDTRSPWAQAAMQRHRIRRNFLVEDGFAAFEGLNDEGQLRDIFRVEFIAPDGTPESGVDGGGLFKEFMVHICRTTFDPEFGLFSATSDQTLYPSTSAFRVHDRNAVELYSFVGKVVGKAIYEMFLLEPQFSRVFLNRLLGRVNEVDDVAALDKELHRNMLQIKESDDVEELGLTFSITTSDLGHHEEVDLIPNGREVPVTKENLTRYFHLMANYKTNVQFQRQTAAFLRGLQCVVPLAWLKMFDPYELNILVSGSTAGFDVRDLQRNTVYSGGYSEDSPVVLWLWQLLSNHLDPEDMGRFLMFATSCSRAPLLGFKNLYPKFCVHRVPDGERLPTASTCANLLKLPDYASFEVLKTKVLQAIHAEAGFDLS